MKSPKIVEQITVVLLFAVLVPFVTIGVIISNLSQQSVRKELNYAATMLSKFLGENIQNYLSDSQQKLTQAARAIPYLYFEEDKADYLREVENFSGLFSNIRIVNKNSTLNGFVFDSSTYNIDLNAPIDENNSLAANINVSNLERLLEEKFSDQNREVFVLDIDNALIAASTKDISDLPALIADLPKDKSIEAPVVYGKVKNQPVAYYKLKNPAWTIIVSTNEELTKSTIDVARFRIALALTLAAFFIIFTVGLYTYYLYINIRQLFKGIIAISKGSYERKIHLIRNVLTPHEVLFLAKEFNYMAMKISQSYKELSEKNIELARLDEFRSNLVSAISHEFRTPLTSIIGYASRLLRQDIKIDKKTQASSLKIIKQQAQMLSRMVEDILVVPDIESFKLQLNPECIDLPQLVEKSILYVGSKDQQFKLNFDSNLKPVYVDEYRMTQILVNLFENATKYAIPDSDILIIGGEIEGKTALMISNKSEPVKEEMLEKLFDKFIRLDGAMTRTTRGTGLGLFIVKGLANAMNIDVNLSYDNESSEFQVTLLFGTKDEQQSS